MKNIKSYNYEYDFSTGKLKEKNDKSKKKKGKKKRKRKSSKNKKKIKLHKKKDRKKKKLKHKKQKYNNLDINGPKAFEDEYTMRLWDGVDLNLGVAVSECMANGFFDNIKHLFKSLFIK